ncbi:MAG: nitroreductase family protein [Treponema sp.]|jgi:nitroreductase|nr:nitroreductase family protein [Treponema sp.]
MIRINFTVVLAIILSSFALFPVIAQQNSTAMEIILNHYAASRNFTSGGIPRADLDRIIQAGVRAPSARNAQPWHFTIVQTQNLATQIVSNNVEGNVLIVVSAPGDGKTNYVQILDAALAVESIYLAAQALGYGSRIYTNPVDTINARLKTELGFPAGYSAVAVIRVGRIEAVDAVSAASSRKRAEDIVNYK